MAPAMAVGSPLGTRAGGAGPAPAMGRPMAGFPMGPPAPEAPPPRARQSESPVFKIVAAVAAAAIGFFAWQTLTRHELRLPSTLASTPKIEAPALATAIDQLRAQAKAAGSSGDIAIYGQGDVPTFIVMVIGGDAIDDQTPDTMFQQFAAGFASTSSSTVDMGHVRRGGDGVATTYCARMRGNVPGALCMWVDTKLVGFVLAPGLTVASTQTLTATIRTETES
jgi:hypothetical protein